MFIKKWFIVLYPYSSIGNLYFLLHYRRNLIIRLMAAHYQVLKPRRGLRLWPRLPFRSRPCPSSPGPCLLRSVRPFCRFATFCRQVSWDLNRGRRFRCKCRRLESCGLAWLCVRSSTVRFCRVLAHISDQF